MAAVLIQFISEKFPIQERVKNIKLLNGFRKIVIQNIFYINYITCYFAELNDILNVIQYVSIHNGDVFITLTVS